MDIIILPAKEKISAAIKRLKELIPKGARVGFYPSSGTQIAVFNFDQLPLDYVICSDYRIAETVQGKIVTVAADNNLCLRYIIEAGIKLDALFAIQDGAIEGGNYEWVNSIGFLGRVLPAMKKSFVFVNNANNANYKSFSEGPVKKIQDDVPIYRAASYSTFDVNTNTYSIVKYRKDYRGSRTLGFEEEYNIKENKHVERHTKSFLKIHYKTIWEDQKWLDGIFVRKRMLNIGMEKTSLRMYWPDNYMSEKVFDIPSLTSYGKLLPLLLFAAKNKLEKIGLVALTGEIGKLSNYEQVFEQNYQELLDWTEPYPKEIHLYFIDNKNYKFALDTIKDFPESQDLVIKPADERYIKLLASFYNRLASNRDYLSLYVNDGRINGKAKLFEQKLIDYYKVHSIAQNGTRSWVTDRKPTRSKQDEERLDSIKILGEVLENTEYLEVIGKGYQLPPACVAISKSGRYSVHDLFHLRSDKGYALWDNKRKVMMREVFDILYGVDEQYGRVYCHPLFEVWKWKGQFPVLDVDLESIEGVLTWRYKNDADSQNQIRKKMNNNALLRRARLNNNRVNGHLNDFSVLYKIPDFYKIRKIFFKKLLFEDVTKEEAYKLFEEYENYSHPHKHFFIGRQYRGENDYYGSNTNAIAELLIENDPGCLTGKVTYGGAGIIEAYYNFCPEDRVSELVKKYEKMEREYEKEKDLRWVEENGGLPF